MGAIALKTIFLDPYQSRRLVPVANLSHLEKVFHMSFNDLSANKVPPAKDKVEEKVVATPSIAVPAAQPAAAPVAEPATPKA